MKDWRVVLDGGTVATFNDERVGRDYALLCVKDNPGSRIEFREVHEVVLDIWEPPVKRVSQFLVYAHENHYREVAKDEGPDPDEDGVLTEAIEENGVTHVRCLVYYSSEGVFEIRVSRPLEQAMVIYMEALKADDGVEVGALKPVEPE